MPAAFAHYLFGKKVYKQLPKEAKQIVKENKEAYWLGLHGPDLLFYYRPLGKNYVNQLGVELHKRIAADFFLRGKIEYEARPSYVLLSYLCGYICHYVLDSECHGYISNYMEEKGLLHSEIETDFDRSLMVEEGLDPTVYVPVTHIRHDVDTEEAIASMYDGITPKIINSCIRYFRFCLRTLVCRDGRKESALKGTFHLMKQDEMTGMVMTGRVNPACGESTEFLKERLEKAVPTAAALITEYVENIENYEPLNVRFNRDFE